MFPKESDWILHMVYIRPTAPVYNSPAIKPVVSSSSLHGQFSSEGDVIDSEYTAANFVERRKENRRQDKKGALLETRASRDRRNQNPRINVQV